MHTFFYNCIHIPTSQVFQRSAQYRTLSEFFIQLCRWNMSNPDVWQYAATGDNM